MVVAILLGVFAIGYAIGLVTSPRRKRKPSADLHLVASQRFADGARMAARGARELGRPYIVTAQDSTK